MKLLLTVVLLTLTLSTASFCQGKAATAATESADRWLALVDAGQYAESWDTAAPLFKGATDRDRWVKISHSTRSSLGKVVSRTMKSAVYTTTLPGAPDGQYVVIQYESSFAHKKSAIETVTTSLEKDDQWKVCGYFIR